MFVWFLVSRQSSTFHRVLQSLDWDPSTADVTAYCDASLDGLGFWFPNLNAGFWSPIPESQLKDTIFYFEALSVLSAIIYSTSLGIPLKKLLIYTNNLNTVQMFNSLSALPAYNDILKAAVDHLLSDLFIPIQLRVLHVPGECNTIADALSRGHLHNVVDNVPDIVINLFYPHVSEGSRGRQLYDYFTRQVQATSSCCLD